MFRRKKVGPINEKKQKTSAEVRANADRHFKDDFLIASDRDMVNKILASRTGMAMAIIESERQAEEQKIARLRALREARQREAPHHD
jgi:hypothetical protein